MRAFITDALGSGNPSPYNLVGKTLSLRALPTFFIGMVGYCQDKEEPWYLSTSHNISGSDDRKRAYHAP